MKVLLFDIETAAAKARIWHQYMKFIPHNMIKEPVKLLMWGAKWLGDDTVTYSTVWDEGEKECVLLLHEMMSEADVIVGHNGDGFDIKHMNTFFIKHGIMPPEPSKTVDTLKVARSRFKFMNNRLDFLGKELGLGGKQDTGGYELWDDVEAGKKKAQNKMIDYCCRDVDLLEQVYIKMRPWIKNHPTFVTYEEGAKPECDCGSTRLIKRGFTTRAGNIYQRYRCKDCGKPLTSTHKVGSKKDNLVKGE